MKSKSNARLMVVAPHPDDEVLGVGGTMARFARAGGEICILTVAAHMPPLYSKEVHETTVAEARRAHAMIGVKKSIFLDNPAVLLREIPLPKFNASIHDAVRDFSPNVLFIPYYDRHVDHRLVFDACMVAARPVGPGKTIKLLAAYETLSETHWNAPHLEPNFAPNWCVDITETLNLKLEAFGTYESQRHPFPEPRSIEALRALALFRGSQAGMAYAESFQIIRMTAAPETFFA